MRLWWSLCTLYLFACQVRVTVGDSGLCCCFYVFQGLINSLVCWSNQVKCHNSVFLTLVKVSRILVSNTEQNGMALAVLHGQISVWVQKCSSHFIYQSKISSASCKKSFFFIFPKSILPLYYSDVLPARFISVVECSVECCVRCVLAPVACGVVLHDYPEATVAAMPEREVRPRQEERAQSRSLPRESPQEGQRRSKRSSKEASPRSPSMCCG